MLGSRVDNHAKLLVTGDWAVSFSTTTARRPTRYDCYLVLSVLSTTSMGGCSWVQWIACFLHPPSPKMFMGTGEWVHQMGFLADNTQRLLRTMYGVCRVGRGWKFLCSIFDCMRGGRTLDRRHELEVALLVGIQLHDITLVKF